MKKKLKKIGIGCLGVCILGVVTCGTVEVKLNYPFAKSIAFADRIVVRDGGFDCCGNVDEQDVLFVVTDKDEIETVRNNIRFVKRPSVGTCKCCGGPGMDWYKGDERIALTAFQHGKAIRWRGFSRHFGYGDRPLTGKSKAWLKEWFKSHDLADFDHYTPRKFLIEPGDE